MSTNISQKGSFSKLRLGNAGILRNVFSNWAAYILAIGVNFFLSPFVVRRLGNTGYGVWTLILSLTGYLGLLDLGIRGAVTRYVAKFHAEKDHRGANNIASSSLVIFSTTAALAILVSVLLATVVVGRMRIPLQYLMAARVLLIVIGLNIAISLVNGAFGGILVGLQRFDLVNIIDVAISLLRVGAVLLVLSKGYGLITLGIVQLGCTLARCSTNILLVKHLYPELSMRVSAADWKGVRLIFSFSIFSFLLHVSSSLIYATDNIVIGAFLPVSAVTFYVIGGNLAEYTRSLVSGISQTMTPLASSTEARNDHQRLERIVLFGGRAGSMVVAPIALTFMLRGSTFIGLWMGPQYAELSGKVLWILSLSLFFWAANSVTAGSLLGLSKHKPLVPILLAEGAANLALSIFWVRGSLGILGVAWGTAVPALASSLIFWPWYIRRTVGIEPIDYMVSAWLRPAIAIAPFGVATYAVERYWPANHLPLFFLQVLLVLPLAVAGYWLTCLDTIQRQAFSRKLSHLFA